MTVCVCVGVFAPCAGEMDNDVNESVSVNMYANVRLVVQLPMLRLLSSLVRMENVTLTIAVLRSNK